MYLYYKRCQKCRFTKYEDDPHFDKFRNYCPKCGHAIIETGNEVSLS